jgi:hypothetical protein
MFSVPLQFRKLKSLQLHVGLQCMECNENIMFVMNIDDD